MCRYGLQTLPNQHDSDAGALPRSEGTCISSIAIPPGARHKIWNTGTEPLVLLCCCAPAYENDDTVMVE